MNTENTLSITSFVMTTGIIEQLLPLCVNRIMELRAEVDELDAQIDELDCGGWAWAEYMHDELQEEELRWNELVEMHEVLTHIAQSQ